MLAEQSLEVDFLGLQKHIQGFQPMCAGQERQPRATRHMAPMQSSYPRSATYYLGLS